LTEAEIFNPVAGTFAATGGLQTPRYEHTLVTLPNGQALAVGGSNASANALDAAEVYQ